MYHQTSLIKVKAILRTITIDISLEIYSKRHKFIKWSFTKRLKQGQLLFVTNYNLDQFVLAEVHYRKRKQKQYKATKKVIVSIKPVDFQDFFRLISFIDKSDCLIIENDQFFLPYYYSMKALKEKILPRQLPFYSQIIQGKKEIEQPLYLRYFTQYQQVIQGIREGRIIKINPRQHLNHGQIQLTQQSKYDIRSLNKYILDSSQYDAVECIINNEISLIQGPPGTGKSFCGALAIEVLLSNSQYYKNSPILIICQTNHALDQFLNHLLRFINTNDIVRIGGGSRDPILKQFNIREKNNNVNFNFSSLIKIKEDVNSFLRQEYSAPYYDQDYEQMLDDLIIDCFQYESLITKDPQLIDKIISDFLDNFNMDHEQTFCQKNRLRLYQIWITKLLPPTNHIMKIFKREKKRNNLKIINYVQLIENFFLDVYAESHPNINLEDLDSFIEDNDFDLNDDDQSEISLNESQHSDSSSDEDDYFKQLHRELPSKRHVFGIVDMDSDLNHYHFQVLFQENNLWDLSLKQRIQYLSLLLKKDLSNPERINNLLQQKIDLFIKKRQKLQKAYVRADVGLLNKHKIVGMTVTGCAMRSDLIKELRPKIVMIEEAAEILESHTIPILFEGLEHLILIGDHKQLRGKVNCQSLVDKYDMNVSLFERLVWQKIPKAILKVQRRMKTKFADFVRLFYDQVTYQDHMKSITSKNNKQLKNITDHLFFDHRKFESFDDFSMSYQNIDEAKMIAQFVKALLKMNVVTEQITVISMYSQQTQVLNRSLKELKVQVKVTTVDSYQGEENDYIILSLVRSNKHGNIGFLENKNRLCVALSRARLGFYVFGNFECIKKHCSNRNNSIWCKIIKKAEEKNIIQNTLEIFCSTHHELTHKVSLLEDWNNVNWCCEKMCYQEICCQSNHRQLCQETCHRGECVCEVQVEKLRSCGHKIIVPCYKSPERSECLIKRMKQLTCGHQKEVFCKNIDQFVDCEQKCDRQMFCGHKCKQKCGHKDQCICNELVENLRSCGHLCKVKCEESVELYICMAIKKKRRRKCGHKIKVPCSDLANNHPCTKPCQKILQCKHQCQLQCSELCQCQLCSI